MNKIDDSLNGLRTYLKERKPEVFLDTNILINASNPKWENTIAEACATMDIRICDTVYWEFLRNTNISNFRTRRAQLANWPNGDLLHEGKITPDEAGTGEMHSRLFLLLCHYYKSDPRRILKYLTPDLWIAAAAVESRADHILTANVDDFPDALFETIASLGEKDAKIHLLVFKRDDVRQCWIGLDDSRKITLSCNSFFSTKKK